MPSSEQRTRARRTVKAFTAAAAAAAVAVAVSVVTIQAAHAAVACRVTYSAPNQWPGGFTVNVTIANIGDALNGWTLTWTFTAGQTVTSSWNANIPTGTSQISATNAGWNGSVPSGGTVSFGFNGTWNNSSNPAPTNFVLNGVACTGSTNQPTSSSRPPTSTSRPPTTTSRPPTTTRPPTTSPPAGQVCTAFGTITMGKYWINNNLWGQDQGTGSQCITGGSVNGNTINWSTTWNWANNPSQVKSYSSSVLGWHWGWMIQNTGLPVQISANRNVNTSWQYQVNANGTFNVAYDCWFHTIPNPTFENQPSDELMIWPYRAGGAGPAGSLVTRVTIAGTQWDLYRGVVGVWNVWSYVRVSNTTSLSFNIRDFINDMVSRGMQTSKYLTSVQAGTEVFVGSGTLTTTAYSTNVS